MAFDKFKNFWNVDIKDGVRGEAHVQSVSQPNESGTSNNCRMWLDVYVEGWEPYRMQHHCMVKVTKYPSPGERLPVMVDKENKERIDILWDEVKTVDEIMREGGPGETPGQVNITMGEGQTIDLSGAGIPPGMEDQVRQAMEMAQQMMGQMQPVTPTSAAPPTPPIAPSNDPPGAAAGGNMVLDRIAQLERLAKLRDDGALSDAEFEAEKAKLLGS